MHHTTYFGMTRQLLIRMQLLIDVSYHFFRYNTTTADWHKIENFTDAHNVSFACLATASLYYGPFGKLFEGFSSLLISDIPKNSVVGTYYRQHDKLVAGHSRFTPDCNR